MSIDPRDSLTVTAPVRVTPGARAARPARTSFVILLLMVAATVSWRRGVYYSGGIDPVVASKAALSLVALALAWLSRQACGEPRPVGSRTFWFVLAYLTVSTYGGLAAGQFLPSAVLAARVLILALTLILLVRTFPAERLLRQLFAAMLTVAAVGSVTGVGSLVTEGRLYGGVPPLHANEIAMLCGLPFLGLTWLALVGEAKARHLVVAVAALGTIYLTGSRTGLLAVLVAVAVMLLLARRLKPLLAVAVAASIPVGVYAIFASELFAVFVQRGGTGNLATLSSRTIAWSAAWSFPETEWARWMGSGLTQKLIPVQGQWWQTQLLDSTWVSALVQAGLVGVLIAVVWMAVIVVAGVNSPWRYRVLFLGLLTYLLIRSILESGMLDSTPPFITLVLVSLLSDRWTRRGLPPPPTPTPQAARAPQELADLTDRWLMPPLHPAPSAGDHDAGWDPGRTGAGPWNSRTT